MTKVPVLEGGVGADEFEVVGEDVWLKGWGKLLLDGSGRAMGDDDVRFIGCFSGQNGQAIVEFFKEWDLLRPP